MTLRTIPRVALGGAIKLVRFPIDTIIRVSGRGEAAEVAIDRAEATVRGAAGAALRDPQIQKDAKLRHEAADERERAVGLREQSDTFAAEAEMEEREAVRKAEQKRQAAAKRAEERKQKAREQREQTEQDATEATEKRKAAAENAAQTKEKRADEDAQEKRADALKQKAEALEKKEKALTATDEAVRLRKQAAKVKEERKSSMGVGTTSK
jgi:colicin import membrane protein